MSDHYQAIVIGAGPGGYPCAIRLGQLGVKTLIVDKQYWGGVCLNVGCIPSKALINAAKRMHDIREASAMGIEVEGVSLDFGKLQAWKGGVVGKLTKGVKQLLKANGVEMLQGSAYVRSPTEVAVTTPEGERTFTTDAIVVATGSSPIEIPGFSFADPPILDSTKALALEAVPKKLVVIGGGYIGLEMAGVYARLGSEITVVEMMDTLLPGFDAEVVRLLTRQLKKEGVRALTSTRALGWEQAEDGIVVQVETKNGPEALPADAVLVTVGRTPNATGFGLEALGIELDGRFLKVDSQLRTSRPGIYAIGDVVGQPMLAHKATHEGEVAAEVIAGKDVALDYKVVPGVVFTDPEIAIAGLSEAEAREKGHEVLVGKVPFAAIGKAIANHDTTGFVKAVVDAETKLILGVTIVGAHASDIISEAALALELAAEAHDVGLTIHPHPTLGESLMEAAKAALGEAIHVVNR